MSDEKKADWLDDANVLLIGAWDVLGRLAPRLVREVKSLRTENEALKTALLDAREGCIAAYDVLLTLPDESIPSIRATMKKGIMGADALGVHYGKPFFTIECNHAAWIACPRCLPTKKTLCPRRNEVPGMVPDYDFWQGDDSCSFCGSLNPDLLMDLIERGAVTLGPTDKSYKVYVTKIDGTNFPQWHTRKCPDVMTCDRVSCSHWTKGQTSTAKFYFPHLSIEQQERFIALFNEKKLKFGEPGGFYVLPFFMKKVA